MHACDFMPTVANLKHLACQALMSCAGPHVCASLQWECLIVTEGAVIDAEAAFPVEGGDFADEQELHFRDQRGIQCSANPFRKCILSYHQRRSRSRGLAEISDASLTLKELAFIMIEVGPLLCLSASCTRANPILHQCTAFVTGTHHACLSMVQPLLSLNMRLHYKLLIKSFCHVLFCHITSMWSCHMAVASTIKSAEQEFSGLR